MPANGTASRHSAPVADDRRAEVVDAAVRVIARDGLSSASLRSIAREIGYTTGVVMHHFTGKQELLVAAADAVLAPFEELLAQASSMADTFEGLRRMCVIPLPTTEAKQVMPRFYAQVLAAAETEPAFAEAFQARYGAIRSGIKSLLAKGQQNGSLRADFDPAAQCDVFCALIDGLALHAVGEPSRFPAARLEALVTHELNKLRP